MAAAALGPAILDRGLAASTKPVSCRPLRRLSTKCASGPADAVLRNPTTGIGLLRVRRERPRGCRAAEQRDERAPLMSDMLRPANNRPARAVGFHRAQPAANRPAGPWGRPELF
jgi:hypothetical protein